MRNPLRLRNVVREAIALDSLLPRSGRFTYSSQRKYMDVFEVLYTTRAMRRVRPDPVPMEVQAQILDAAVRGPSGGNSQGWRFLLVDDREIMKKLAPLY